MAIPITTVLDMVGIPYSATRSSENIPCPICDGDRQDRNHRHLNVNFNKNLFRCPKCDSSGGSVALYGFLVKGIDPESVKGNKERYIELAKEISAQLGNNAQLYNYNVQHEEKPPVDFPPTDVESRNETYSALLGELTLSKEHYNSLVLRGLRKEDIEKNGYKTVPVLGVKKIPKLLRQQGLELAGVPGFFKKDNQWAMLEMGRGFYVPVRDLDGVIKDLDTGLGQIQGLQVRMDKPTRNNKYMWLSTRDYVSGCGAETWCHFKGYPEKEIILTEGPLKADIIYRFLNKPVIAVPGVNALKHLDDIFETLKKLGVKKINTAFDMDFKTNPHVQKGYEKLLNKISSYGFKYEMLFWDEEYKGYDDYLLHCYLERGGKLDPLME